MTTPISSLPSLLTARATLRGAFARLLPTQGRIADDLLTALVADGHGLLLLEPGALRNALLDPFASALGLSFVRLQCTPDLEPADITGSGVAPDHLGPLFHHLDLATDFDLASADTRDTLVRAMTQRQAEVVGQAHDLPAPFFVLATFEGGAMPTGQPDELLGSFLLAIPIPSPTDDEWLAVYPHLHPPAQWPVVLSPVEILALQQHARGLPLQPSACAYAEALVRATRPEDELALAAVRRDVLRGAGASALQGLLQASRARAVVQGAPQATCAHVRAVAPLVLPHRLRMAEPGLGAGPGPSKMVARLLDTISEP